MPQEWTADVVARMHMARITTKQLAQETGYTVQYVSMVLNGHRNTANARTAILSAIERLETTERNLPAQPTDARPSA